MFVQVKNDPQKKGLNNQKETKHISSKLLILISVTHIIPFLLHKSLVYFFVFMEGDISWKLKFPGVEAM